MNEVKTTLSRKEAATYLGVHVTTSKGFKTHRA